MEDTGEKSTMSTAAFLTFAMLLVLMTLSWSQPGKAAPTSNDYDPEGSRPNVEESANELKRMRFGRQTASSMLQSSQMAIRQMQDISFEEEREEDIDRRGEEKQPWGKVSAKGKNCRQDFPCGYHDYDYYWCKLSGGSWDYCCTPSSKCNKQGSCYTSRLRQAQQIGFPFGHPKVRTWA